MENPNNGNEKIYVTAAVQFTLNRLEAYLTLKHDANGRILSRDLLNDALARNGVVNGIDEAVLDRLANFPEFDTQKMVACGTDSVPGEDAEIRFLFDLQRDLSPKVKDDGSVDFKDLGIIQAVSKGDLLAIKKPKTEGIPGKNVCGQPIDPKPGKEMALPAGRNVVVSEDKLKLFAEFDGQVIYHNDRVSVLNTYTVDGDVSTATGNITFNGNVLVKGGVQSGYKIKAAGNVEVYGVVEAAEIQAEGDIIIRNGFNGGEKGQLTAEGNISTKFIQGGNVLLGGKLETTYIYNSRVRSKNSINVIGKGIILGGHVVARTRIDAGTIGNESSTKTIVEVGSDPETLQRNQELLAELDACKKNVKAFESAVDTLKKLKEAGKLPPEREEQYAKSQLVVAQLNAKLDGLISEKETIDEKLSYFGKGYIGVRGIAYPGVVIVMGQEQMPLKGKYSHSLFSRSEGYIKSGPL